MNEIQRLRISLSHQERGIKTIEEKLAQRQARLHQTYAELDKLLAEAGLPQEPKPHTVAPWA